MDAKRNQTGVKRARRGQTASNKVDHGQIGSNTEPEVELRYGHGHDSMTLLVLSLSSLLRTSSMVLFALIYGSPGDANKAIVLID